MNPLDAKVNFPCLILSIDSNLPLLELRLGVDTFFCFHKSSSEENHGNSLLRCEDRTRDASALIRSSSSCSCRRASNLIPWIAYAWNIMKQWFSCKILLGNSVWKFILYSLILILQAAKKKITWRRSSAVRLDSSMLSRRAASLSKAWELQVLKSQLFQQLGPRRYPPKNSDYPLPKHFWRWFFLYQDR